MPKPAPRLASRGRTEGSTKEFLLQQRVAQGRVTLGIRAVLAKQERARRTGRFKTIVRCGL
jgi:hypothetical protein